MSTWDHRVVKRRVTMPTGRRETFYQIREVYRDGKGVPNGVTQDAITPGGGTVDELREELVLMLRATYRPVFKVSEASRKKNKEAR